MAFRFDDDFRARLLALPTLVRRGGGSPEGAGGTSKGGRVEFKDHRPYVHGDDVRDLDWHGYLRLDQLLIKEHTREEAPEVALLLDRSASMGGSPGEKDRLVRELCAGLGYVGLAARCPVTVMICAEGGPVTVGAWRSHRKVDQLLACLEGLGEPDGDTHLRGLRHLRPPSASGRVAFVLSDFLLDPLPAEMAVALARGAGSGCLLHVITDQERRPSLPGSCTLLDPESGERLFLADAAGVAAAYGRQLAEHEDAVARLAAGHGVASHRVGDGEPFEKTVAAVCGAQGAAR